MPLLYDNPASGNAYKVRLLLAHLAREYERVPVDIFDAGHPAPALLAVNPIGRVPVWVDDEVTLGESAAILTWLGEGSPYLPAARADRVRVLQWLCFEQNLFEPTVATGRFWRAAGRGAQRPDAYARFVEAGTAATGVLERRLADVPFLSGDEYTIADMAAYAYAHVAGEADVDLAAHPAVVAWIARVEAQPGFMNDLAPYPPTVAQRRG